MEKRTWNEIPDEELIRLDQNEMNSLLWLFSALSICKNSEDDLSGKLDLIPEGKYRFQLMLELLQSITSDLVKITPAEQREQLKNAMNDMELRIARKRKVSSMKRISLEDARLCAGMNKKQVSAAMGISIAKLSLWEHGTKLPTVDQAIEISKLYGIPMSVIDWSKERNKPVYVYDKLRKMIGYLFESTEEFAKFVGIEPSIIMSRLDGESNFSCDELATIAEKLNLGESSINDLFFEQDRSSILPVCTLIRKMLTDEECSTLQAMMEHGWPGTLKANEHDPQDSI